MRRAELAGRAPGLPDEEAAEVRRLGEAQPAADVGDRDVGTGEQPLGFQRHPGVDHLLGAAPGRGETGPGEGTHRVAQPFGVVLDPAGTGERRLDLAPELEVGLPVDVEVGVELGPQAGAEEDAGAGQERA